MSREHNSAEDIEADRAARVKAIEACAGLLALLIEHHPERIPVNQTALVGWAKKSPAPTRNGKTGQRNFDHGRITTSVPVPQLT